MIDVNVSLSRWPFRRLSLDETPRLVAALRAGGVTQAWAGSFDALLHEDIAGVNARLADECRRHGDGLLVPFGAINPRLPDWPDDLRRCHEDHHMPGVRLHPNYHGYTLDDPVFAALLRQAAERRLIVQIALSMEDQRTQHPLVAVPPVDPTPLTRQLTAYPKLPIVLLNALREYRGETLSRLAQAGNVFFEIATLEGLGGLEKLVKLVPPERILFGSGSPYFILESARLKLRESEIGDHLRTTITETNAHAVMEAAR